MHTHIYIYIINSYNMLKPWRQRREVWTPFRRFRLVLILCVWNCGMPGFLAISMRHLHDEQIQWLIINAISMVIHGLWLISGFRGSPDRINRSGGPAANNFGHDQWPKNFQVKESEWLPHEDLELNQFWAGKALHIYIYIYIRICVCIYI